MRWIAPYTMILCVLMACAAPTHHLQSPPFDRNHIFPEEIHRLQAANALELIKSLRPNWLHGRGAKSILFEEASYPVVYVNGNRLGDVSTLATLPADNITEMQYLNAGDATIRFGLNHPGGAILITIF